MARRAANLVRRNGTYYFRCRVPDDLRPVLGKQEISISLRTKDYGEGRKLAAGIRHTVLLGFAEMRNPKAKHTVKMKTPAWLPLLVKLGADKDLLTKQLREGIAESVQASLDEIVKIQSEAEGDESKRLDSRVAQQSSRDRQWHEALEFVVGATQRIADCEIAESSEIAQEHKAKAEEATNALVTLINSGKATTIQGGGISATPLHPDSKKPFHAFTEQFMEQKRLGKKERTNRRTAFNNLRHIVGDKPIHKIGVNEIIGFRDFVARQRGRHGRTDANYKTVNKKLSFLRVFFDWAKEERNLISENPVTISAKPSRAEREAEEENRRPFTATELEHIFHSPLFVGCKSLRRIHDSGTVLCRNEKFWFPIIGLYTGCRVDEIQQLEVTDIIQYEGRWCLDISRESQFGRKKTTKNKASIRRVPLHADLTKMGFMDYWKIRQGNAKDGLLFPKYGYGKMFNETLLTVRLGIKQPEISFHSLRHNFKDVAANATESDFVVSRLMGHSQNDMTGRYGTRQYLSGKQMAVIDRMRFPISMAHLFV